MRVAVVGGGISGLTAAFVLSKKLDVTLFEAAPKLGGHTHTVAAETAQGNVPIDMGFIVFNEENYPGLVRLLAALDVASQPSEMSFGVSSERSGTEYKASNLSTLFAQRRNLASPSFHRMLWDVARFRRRARSMVSNGNGSNPSLGEFLGTAGYSRRFIDEFIVPMGTAIWSADPGKLDELPARTLLQFFENHRFLDPNDQPQWRTVVGGSKTYVDRIAAHLGTRLRLSSPVREVRRLSTHVEIATDTDTTRFDHVFLCAHSDQTLGMLKAPSSTEEQLLRAIPYQRNETTLHTDSRVMPRSKRAWASWNVRVPKEAADRVHITYHSNRLQALSHPTDFFVTLNRGRDIQPKSLIEAVDFDHPIFTLEGITAQKRRHEINGRNRTSFCGAYWGYGFHEDGVQSALLATEPFGVGL